MGFRVIRITGYAFYRTDLDTLRCIKMPYTLGAFFRVNDIILDTHCNGFIGTFRLTDITVDALFCYF